MTEASLQSRFDSCTSSDKALLAVLALAGEPMSAARIGEHLAAAHLPGGPVDESLPRLRKKGLADAINGRGTAVRKEAVWPAIRHAIDSGALHALRRAYEKVTPQRKDWRGFVALRSYRQGVALLRMALFGGDSPRDIAFLLSQCLDCHEAAYLHPLVDICGRPFDPDLMDHILPEMRSEVLAVLLADAQHAPASAAALRQYALRYVAEHGASMGLRMVLAEHLILCGDLRSATALLDDLDVSLALFFKSAIAMLRGDPAALAGFTEALKVLRRETGKRKLCFPGIGGHLYVLGLIRSGDPKHDKAADTYLDCATRAVQSHDTAVYEQLSMLRRIRGGTVDADVLPSRNWETALQPFMFRALLHYWLSLPQLKERRAAIEEMLAQSEAAGFDLISAQLAALLGHLGSIAHEQRAIELRQRHGLPDMTAWFEREEPWQRQLNALINLQPATSAEVPKESRLVWLIDFEAGYGIRGVEPLEQRRDAKGGWSKGRPVSLKRLYMEGRQLDFVSAHDLAAIGLIAAHRWYGGNEYRLDDAKAAGELIGHPLLFWKDAPGTRVELLPGEPELLVRAKDGSVTITMQPPISGADDDVVVTRETQTRLRVVCVRPEHRSVGDIVGNGLVVPLHAEKQVLKAISAISSIVTVQSDIGSSAADIEQVEADSRLHVHLLPYQHGLKMQVLVRPLPGAGAWYPPGTGAESVIADVEGVRTEARRNLNAEREAERQLVGACHALEEAESDHGEWLLGQPVACLELLAELQELDPAKVTVAWPEGQPFRVTRKADSKSMRLSIKRDKDWFAAGGEVQVDEGRVLDLRTLLDLLKSSKGRFVELGNNEFMALSSELHRRLMELAAFGDVHGDGVRVHPLASFALQELAADAGGVKADKLWKEHLARIAQSEAFVPQLPTTLQADLRDYQREGFEWLARLAHWGVGACLADDMGLGKTVQALAMILSRAPQGPTLVVAPTSVCMNWMAEAARFAPTLNVKLFGAGDRAAMLGGVQPFDLVIASYGLLQLEAELFAKVQWHTIVLDEAQAIKNNATKRSQAVMALQGGFRMAATGTPLENHLGELWNLFRFINPGLLGTSDQFNLKFAGPIERAQDKRAAAAARARLKRLIQPFILRRTKAQVLSELPPRTEIVVPVDLTEQEAALYETLRRDAVAKLATLEGPESQKSIQVLAEMMKLRRACCNPHLVAPELNLASSKLTVFGRLLDGLLENRHKVLVFSQFVDHLALIRKHLDARAIPYQYLDGATPMQARKERVDAFQAGEGDVFLISLKAGGVGINLTAADYVIHMDPWWNPAVEDQASDRAHRMGQQRPVTIYRLVAKNTIEEGIVDLHKHKRDLADSLLDGSDAASRMSTADMLRMLQEGLGQRS